jgi:hypothetical protein
LSFFPPCFFRRCTNVRQEERWIQINGPDSEGKRNKPAEKLYEVLRVCNECDRIREKFYFTEEQIKDFDKRRIADAQRVAHTA